MEPKLTVTRWRRYGKDRLYVSTVDGVRVGWHDLVSGEMHVEATADRDAVVAATAHWRESASLTAGEVMVTQPVAAAPAIAEPTSDDPLAAVQLREPAVIDVGKPPEGIGPSGRQTSPAVGGEEPAAAVEDWEDLALRRAGAEAREQAVALRQAAPVRTFVARVLGVHTDERAWRVGADGEEKVAGQLAKLIKRDPRWRVLHAIPVGDRGSDIDHLVIGPGAVYSLNAKHHRGAKVWVGGNTFMVNGQRQPYLRNSRHEAERASKLLTGATGRPVVVTGVVVPVGADELVIKQAPTDVHVVSRMRLVKWLQARPEVLDATAIEAVYEAARRSTAWQTTKADRPQS
ncbi:nuclease-related domain-containing protein [Micromonospora sp. CB01531]|uniref:nuclease-related domain-containing protein n=1 Tax=Micromonospora sp. CB01531 TaxID=1718947 RepID=UPI000A58AB42|nr:nuclease-related domain-containing protein [Micromonospora sp. CB01531]